jgi:hypothetical protein
MQIQEGTCRPSLVNTSNFNNINWSINSERLNSHKENLRGNMAQ